MKAAIVTIGDEILIGQIADTNSTFIAKALDRIGVQTVEMRSISDQREALLHTFSAYQNQVDFVVMTGGLGPTKDDITKKTLADYFEDTLVRNSDVEQHVVALIEKVLQRPASQLNKDQALVPSQAQVLFNAVGTAPGMWIQKEQTVFISMPGVPYEMKHLMEQQVIPKIAAEYQRPYILHKTLLTYGLGESVVAERIEAWENQLPEYIKLAYLPAPGRVRLRLTARGTDLKLLEEAVAQAVAEVTPLISDILVGFEEDETIEVVVGRLLAQNGQTLATAESCTGGKIAQLLTSVSGASAYFKGSVVCYATEIKTKLLGVDPQLIATHSVVSAEVAKAMALGVQTQMQSDYALATTGNAGPQKGESDAEVGTVFIALATPQEVVVERFNFGQPREKVVDRATVKALEMLQKEILKNL
ncbi:MAG: CinA family nicotinamide mononucleotide deamidase-related protein [Flavobacterium sp.]|jgi:nicotinamide-nucleotide amidase|uniref:CinA family nicotinamide mononucleotide deamidase-related protein n=1 Tax=Flavobacterium sp. TaxID=239 RepID=UPI0022C28EB2|nr:CinA family nicotinamide mononucleotide deamidase-related protein [Flavobacterium sp.]MCZ8169638.1 CinA family nicotinamide mononucleotide deamidase-related protein [Flavobacterium sp.]MCZ8296479.1 CinA family nicotinamide mononucleotide deamidase-related protein [Flavobacterium sp.]